MLPIGSLCNIRRRFYGVALAAAMVCMPALHGPQLLPRASADPAGQACSPYVNAAVKCSVHSAAMNRDISVVIRPSHTANNPRVIQFLGGMGIKNDTNEWLTDGHALEHLASADATLVFPAGDSASLYTDWDHPTADGRVFKYKTFLSEELPAYLANNFGVPGGGAGHTLVTGISAGAWGAMSLAAQRPDFYRSVLAMSGFYDSRMPDQWLTTDLQPLLTEGVNTVPWFNLANRRAANPSENLQNLTMPIIVTSASGVINPLADYGDNLVGVVTEGVPMEVGATAQTAEFVAQARAVGVDIDYRLDPIGVHGWDTWSRMAWDQGVMDQALSKIG
ncbi:MULTISPECIES: alpha/beta hydrolase [Corynebacterium]|uniref:alpha/beta hydrolase n=1 Tax=Corynebacterium TaxID=1716 RepID=UPI00264F4091|nr:MULTISPECIES: alpha/beta hydrolase-fold protein [Corynebacterium]MDN8624988.1 alpha/beta hydrolase-fold protein [Corynebacterium kroppenstedtii]